MRRFLAAFSTLTLALTLPVCGGSDGDEPLDGENEAFGGPKADGFCVDEGTIEAVALLELVNNEDTTVDELDKSASDGGAGLNRRAAENIVDARPIETLGDLDAVPFVGVDSCTKLVAYACDVKGLCEPPPAACEVGNASNREFDLVALEDPIAELVLKTGDGCPSSYLEIIEKMRQTDTDGCSGGGDGMSTAVVTEEGQVTGEFTSGRTVITRSCGGRTEHEVLFSLFGVRPGSSLPESVEVMGFDTKAGVYNYYTLEGGEWEFHGNSIDLVTTQTQRCAACHTGGGPIMKELDTPWLHWEGHQDTNGVSAFIDEHRDDLGFQSDGIGVEGLVRDGNRKWNDARLKFMLENGGVADVLRPLFCTVEFNLDNGADFFSPPDGTVGEGSDLNRIPRDFLVDPQWSGFGGVSVASEVYQQAIMDAGQTLRGSSGQLTGENGNPAIDTIFDFVFPERAMADDDYVDKLVSAGVVDEDFVKDVLAIDFTAPIFSDARCDLLQFSPELDSADRTPDKIREGFLANLPSSGAAGELAGFLENKGDAGDHQAAVDAFVAACEARDEAAFMTDVMQIASQRRKLARDRPVMEFPATMPQDTLSVSADARFDPTTCEVN